MNKFLPLAAAVATAFSMVPAQANTLEAHDRLVDAVRNTGVSIFLNTNECVGASFSGYYSSVNRRMIICQDNGNDGSYKQASWTENDLDTLRHEAVHITQDCVAGPIADNSLGTIFHNPFEFAQDYFGNIVIQNIVASYKRRGATAHIQVLEVEAFAIAEMNNPDEQIDDLRHYCL